LNDFRQQTKAPLQEKEDFCTCYRGGSADLTVMMKVHQLSGTFYDTATTVYKYGLHIPTKG
jgi:hypothetical protein